MAIIWICCWWYSGDCGWLRVYVGSHNLTQNAWGVLRHPKRDAVWIQNMEFGVLLGAPRPTGDPSGAATAGCDKRRREEAGTDLAGHVSGVSSLAYGASKGDADGPPVISATQDGKRTEKVSAFACSPFPFGLPLERQSRRGGTRSVTVTESGVQEYLYLAALWDS